MERKLAMSDRASSETRKKAGHLHGGKFRRAVLAFAVALLATPLGMQSVAWAAAADTKPYDEKLMRLAEILGAMHYLRELCSANEGMLWRDKMKDLLDSEGSTALRRARLTRSFNQGYRSYRRTYVSCTPTAQTSISRFMTEGVQISEALVKAQP